MKEDLAKEGVNAAPPVAVTAIAWMSGLTLNEAVGYATLAYIGLQALYLVWKWWHEFKRKGRR